MGLQVGQGEQKTKGISECERKIKKIKTMRGEIALANGVFQQPARGNGFFYITFAKSSVGWMHSKPRNERQGKTMAPE
ncbi:hypothetical protein B9Z45_00990 [Limnohabitans sp. 2KL-17]|uniref:hypothetical protein n=1 Tax=Limnohabitans sp. 2KL-17 TaxID=1100704 RepID=UPI000D3804BE|nr:hypothetical protein [Limnohabitans sp. 2KL-17]PUE62965.1 hypothetical protein B9Z45_00990 [Limnohabitans sp. 2KL-17]